MSGVLSNGTQTGEKLSRNGPYSLTETSSHDYARDHVTYRLLDTSTGLYWTGRHSFLYDEEARKKLEHKQHVGRLELFSRFGVSFATKTRLLQDLINFISDPSDLIHEVQQTELLEFCNPIPESWVIERRVVGEISYCDIDSDELTLIATLRSKRLWVTWVTNSILKLDGSMRDYKYLAAWKDRIDATKSVDRYKEFDALVEGLNLEPGTYRVDSGAAAFKSEDSLMLVKLAAGALEIIDLDKCRKKVFRYGSR